MKNKTNFKRKLSLIIKRFFDLILAFILLIPMVIVSMIVGLIIKLEDGGPIFFVQKRNGYLGKEFNMIKFRTMPINTNTINFSEEKEITKIGCFLRKTSLDELPQILNIIKNDMSFVGPRAWISQYYPYYTTEQKKRFLAKPGITGYAQVFGRKAINILDRIEKDIYYVENYSLCLDIRILLRTFVVLTYQNNDSLRNTVNTEYEDLIANYNKVNKNRNHKKD